MKFLWVFFFILLIFIFFIGGRGKFKNGSSIDDDFFFFLFFLLWIGIGLVNGEDMVILLESEEFWVFFWLLELLSCIFFIFLMILFGVGVGGDFFF